MRKKCDVSVVYTFEDQPEENVQESMSVNDFLVHHADLESFLEDLEPRLEAVTKANEYKDRANVLLRIEANWKDTDIVEQREGSEPFVEVFVAGNIFPSAVAAYEDLEAWMKAHVKREVGTRGVRFFSAPLPFVDDVNSTSQCSSCSKKLKDKFVCLECASNGQHVVNCLTCVAKHPQTMKGPNHGASLVVTQPLDVDKLQFGVGHVMMYDEVIMVGEEGGGDEAHIGCDGCGNLVSFKLQLVDYRSI